MFPLIIELIYWSLASNDIRLLIFGLLRDYLKKDRSNSLKQTLKQENVKEDELDQPFSLFNPTIISKLLKLITPAELNVLTSEINKIKKAGKTVSKLFKKDINNEETKEDKEIKNPDSNNWTILSSSWFKRGMFKTSDQNTKTGELTTLFQSDTAKNKKWYGPYTYPSFPSEVWEVMKKQTGKNGNGAGTIFWRYWNKTWLPSQLRKYVKGRLAKSKNITKGKQIKSITLPNNINMQKTLAYIHRLERNFPKLKKFSNLSNIDVGSNAWRESRKNIVNKVGFVPLTKNLEPILSKNKNKWGKL